MSWYDQPSAASARLAPEAAHLRGPVLGPLGWVTVRSPAGDDIQRGAENLDRGRFRSCRPHAQFGKANAQRLRQAVVSTEGGRSTLQRARIRSITWHVKGEDLSGEVFFDVYTERDEPRDPVCQILLDLPALGDVSNQNRGADGVAIESV
jgi:hypothetical protein